MNQDINPLSLTRKLLSFNTINPPGNEHECAIFLGRLLEAAEYEVVFHSFAQGRTSLVARGKGIGDKPPICFSGHLDTVPLGKATWSREPFKIGLNLEGRLFIYLQDLGLPVTS